MVVLLLGYDIGSSSIKAALLDAETGRLVAGATSLLTFIGDSTSAHLACVQARLKSRGGAAIERRRA